MDAQPSRTAYRVALRRAAHQRLDQPPVFVDPLALRIIDAPDASAIAGDPARFETSVVAPFLRAFLAVRSRIAEDEVARAVAAGVRQYVVLGAGLDTFAYRNPHEVEGLRVFEVDHPATQAWKRERLAAASIDIPPSMRFVAIDFERASLPDALSASGFAADASAQFSWLGVVPYLREDAVMRTLTDVAAAAGPDGGIVFDYATSPDDLPFLQRRAFDALAARVAAAGEPFLSFFAPARIDRELRARGFDDVIDLSPEEIHARYFANRRDGLSVGSLGRITIARARTRS